MKAYRVRYWLEDGSQDFWECDTMQEALEFYDSRNGLAEVQMYDGENHCYVDVLYPTLEY